MVGDVFLEGAGDPGPAAPGKRARLVTLGRLPYRLRWELVCAEARPPNRLASWITGDFGGEGIWTITGVEFLIGGASGCDLRLPASNLPPVICQITRKADGVRVRRLTPVLRPVFAWNHHWAMERGERRIVVLARSRD